MVFGRFMHALAPEGTWLRRLLRLPRRVARSVKNKGLGGTCKVIRNKLRRRGLRSDQIHLLDWLEANEPARSTLRAQTLWATATPGLPVVTLVARVDRSAGQDLLITLRSLQRQSYPHWQFCLVAGPKALPAARALANRERRLTVLKEADLKGDGFINTALPACRGDYIGVVDTGDSLAPHALYEIARALAADPADVLYTDEHWQSHRSLGVVLKPDWSPELLLAYNYLGRLTLWRRSLLERLGGTRAEYGMAQEWDLLLRAAETAARLRRLPLCLYQRGTDRADWPEWRAAPFVDAQRRRALADHLHRRGLNAEVMTTDNGAHRAIWPVRGTPRVSIIVPTVNQLPFIRRCVADLVDKTSYPHKEIILVDNQSTDPAVLAFYQEQLSLGRIQKVVPFHQDFNYSAACNAGYQNSTGDFLLFLNNDIEVLQPDWLDELVRFGQLPDVGCVGTKLIYPDGRLQHSGVVIGLDMCGLINNNAAAEDGWNVFGSADTYRNYLAVMGACQLLPRQVFEKVGGFDERYRIANSDVAIALRAWRAGYRTIYTPFACLKHHEGATRGKINPVDDLTMTARDLRALEVLEDPFYHPALSPHRSAPTLRLPTEPTPRRVLLEQLHKFAPMQDARPPLDLGDDAAIRHAVGDQIALPRTVGKSVDSARAAARFVLQLLRGNAELRQRFPRALSDGVAGNFFRWLCQEHEQLGLPQAALSHVRTAFQEDPGARIRQLFELGTELRQELPMALLPEGRRGLLAWLARQGKAEYDLCDEAIWWFLLACAEDPARELTHTYLVTPEWQLHFPDALTPFGRERFVAWLRHRFGLCGSWLKEWTSPLAPLDQLRIAYSSRPRWRNHHPQAFADIVKIRRLAAWLRQDKSTAALVEPQWWNSLDADLTTAGLTHGLNLLGHFCYPSGLQASACAVAEGLGSSRVRVVCRDVPAYLATDTPGRADSLGLELFDTTLIHVQPDTDFCPAVYRKAGLQPRRDVYRIAMWYWEFGQVPPEWGRYAESVQEIWAPTRFIAQALTRTVDVPVVHMFPGVRLGPTAVVPRSRYGIPEDRLMFLFMLDVNSIMERKNPLGLIAAFRRAFCRDDRVVLVIKVSRGQNNPRGLARLQEAARAIDAILIDSTLSRAEANGLIQACACYVSLHRAEGLGLTMAEAMLLGKPVIATGYSGNLDFMSHDNSLLVDYRLVPLQQDVPPYRKDYLWAEPATEMAAHWLRWVYENQDEARALGARAQAHAQKELALERAGRRMAQRLEVIAHTRGRQQNLAA
ncbi:MAG: glycosyltransferase [Gemmataceae bacterium]